MTEPRSDVALAALPDGSLLLVGGWGANSVLDSTERFDPASGSFVPSADLLAPRDGCMVATLADGRVLVLGGWDSKDKILKSVEIYQ